MDAKVLCRWQCVILLQLEYSSANWKKSITLCFRPRFKTARRLLHRLARHLTNNTIKGTDADRKAVKKYVTDVV
jgi:hypothetical protein